MPATSRTARRRSSDSISCETVCCCDVWDTGRRISWGRSPVAVSRATEISPSNVNAIQNESWALRLKGLVSEADAVLDQALQLFPDDADLIAETADAAYQAGDNERFLSYLERSVPGLFADPPKIEHGPGFIRAHWVAWALRLKGDDDRSEAVIAAYEAFVRPRMHIYPDTADIWLEQRAAAARGDVVALEKALRQYLDSSAMFTRFLIDPMFLSYQDQPRIAAIYDEMREADRVAREQLAAEGIF